MVVAALPGFLGFQGLMDGPTVFLHEACLQPPSFLSGLLAAEPSVLLSCLPRPFWTHPLEAQSQALQMYLAG